MDPSGLVVASDSSVIRMSLENTGRDTNAAGTYLSVLKGRSSVLNIRATGLTPGATYGLEVGGNVEATTVADAKGRCSLTLSAKPRKNGAVLDFDPRGQLVALSDGVGSVLQGMVSASGEPSGVVMEERARLTTLSGTGEADARYRVLKDGRRSFSVKLERVTGTNWQLYVDGIWRGELPLTGRQTTVYYETAPLPPGRRLLDFDPRGQIIDIAQGTNLVFSGRLAARAEGVNSATPSLTQSFVPSTGADADGTARARLRVESDARRKFSIELEDVPVGAYELLVNDVVQGTINVATSTSGTEGELEFSSREDNGDELPLNFNPATSMFVVRRDGVIYFQGTLSGSVVSGGSNGGANTNAFAPDSLAGLTLNLDDQPGGDLMEFTTSTTGVDLGTDPDPFTYVYTKLAANQARVEVRDGSKLDAYVFTFATLSSGSWTRDEYRDGLLKDRDTGRFTVAVGTNTGGTGTNTSGGGVLVSPTRIDLPLFNAGIVSGRAEARFKRDDRGRRNFEVQLENVPVGNYLLWVNGASVGTITVTAVTGGTHGEIEFEDDDDSGHPALTFNPLGQMITVTQDSVTLFQRVFPTGN